MLNLTIQVWWFADLLESEMLASETAPISYPGVVFEDEVAEPCFTTLGKLVEKARMVGQAYEERRCLGLSLDMTSSRPVLASGEGTTMASNTPEQCGNHERAVSGGGTEPAQVWTALPVALPLLRNEFPAPRNERERARSHDPVSACASHVCRHRMDGRNNRSGHGGQML